MFWLSSLELIAVRKELICESVWAIRAWVVRYWSYWDFLFGARGWAVEAHFVDGVSIICLVGWDSELGLVD